MEQKEKKTKEHKMLPIYEKAAQGLKKYQNSVNLDLDFRSMMLRLSYLPF